MFNTATLLCFLCVAGGTTYIYHYLLLYNIIPKVSLTNLKSQIPIFRGKIFFSVNLEEAGRRKSSDLDQLIVVIQVPMGSPEVHGDIDQLVDVTSVSLSSLGIWSRFPPPPLSPSHSSSISQLTLREWNGCNAEVSCSEPFLTNLKSQISNFRGKFLFSVNLEEAWEEDVK